MYNVYKFEQGKEQRRQSEQAKAEHEKKKLAQRSKLIKYAWLQQTILSVICLMSITELRDKLA